MQISDVMTSDVKLASPDQSIRSAAQMMQQLDAGILPVSDGERLIGMISDRDIAIRGVGAGLSPDTPVHEVMSREVMYCFDDDDVEDVARNMSSIKVRRLPVLNREKRLVGIVSLGDMALADGPSHAGEALCGISQKGGAHSQSYNGGRGRTAM